MRVETNRDPLIIFSQLARYYIRANDRGRSMAYTRIEETIKQFDSSGESFAYHAARGAVPGVGPSILRDLDEIIRTGTCSRFETVKRQCPPHSVLELEELKGVGPATAFALWEKYGITSVSDLRKKIDRVHLNGGGDADRQLREALADHEKSRRVPREEVEPEAKRLLARIRRIKGVSQADIAGSLRRGLPLVKDADIVVGCNKSAVTQIQKLWMDFSTAKDVVMEGEQRIRFFLKECGRQCDIIMVPAREYATALQYLTGSQAFNIGLRAHAQSLGFSLSEHGLKSGNGESRYFKMEEGLFKFLGLPYVKPRDRESWKGKGTF